MVIPKFTRVVDYKAGLQRSRIDIIMCMLNIAHGCREKLELKVGVNSFSFTFLFGCSIEIQ